jgi:DNA uptake protein ComE-like DNA-binding protein
MANAKPSYAEVASPTAVSSNFAQPHNGVDSNSTVSALQEISERQRREQNLVFVNLSANKDAKMAVVDYCVSHLNVSEVKKEEVLYARYIAPKATDKSSITIARFRSKELRDRILTAAKQRSKQDIANSRIYVNPDLTKVQREEFSRLRAEVARRNAAGERVRVMGSRIVKIRDTAALASTENKKDSVAASAKSVQKQPRVRNGQLKTRPAEESDTEERVDLNAAISNDE